MKDNKIDIIDKKDVFDKLYYQEYRTITSNDIKNNDKFDKNIVQFMKEEISKIEDKVPLYDIYANNIFLIDKYSVYERVTNQYYRFPDKELMKKLQEQKEEMKDVKSNSPLYNRTIKKLDLMITFMSYFDLDILYKTYIYVFYKYSKFVGQELTICKRPSFLPQFYHLKPYYTRIEMINLAKNAGEDIKNTINDEQIKELCKKISNNDITYKTLLDHKKYMVTTSSIGLVQFYTFQGSFMMNQYLRSMTIYKNKNVYLEELIKPMWKLILSAPKFDKKYTLYRFIKNDDYISNLKINDTFTEGGFMSTTRDPFYRPENDQFGTILIKINIPFDVEGVALALETVSYFPQEQEVIFPPKSKFKLIKKNSDFVYFHVDEEFAEKIKTKYEFDWISNDKQIQFSRNIEPIKIEIIDFLKIQRKIDISFPEKIKDFVNNYINKADQFIIKLDKQEYTVLYEQYDSTEAYKKFYAITTSSGFSIYSIYDNNILFFIEIAEVNNDPQMHINYYVKYSAIDQNKIVGDDNLMLFYAQIAYFFDIHNIIIYANYMSCDSTTITANTTIQRTIDNKITENKETIVSEDINTKLFGGSYCLDFYQYFTTNKKKYFDLNILNIELHPKFSYYDLDMLKTISPTKIIKKEDNEIYQVYDKIFKLTKNNDNIADFYIWLKETHCYLIDNLITKIDRILGNNNPFKKDFYVFDPISYLYNRNYIKTYSSRFKLDSHIR
jgi:hypothetical protein